MEDKDNRVLCKYGVKCYQKNEKHKRMYKHIQDEKVESGEPPRKKGKIEEPNSPIKPVSPTKPTSLDKQESDKVEDSRCCNPLSPESAEQVLKEKFNVEMPKDFYDLWKHCQLINPEKPEDAFKSAGLTLCGPFDLLSGKIGEDVDADRFWCHWRYYYNPPEFQTVIAGVDDEYHIGYYRDAPSDLPVFAASMSNKRPGVISPIGDNLFTAVISFLKSVVSCGDIFNRSKINKLIKAMEIFAEENNYDGNLLTAGMKARGKKVVAKTFHGAGIVVPVCKETDVGYREIPETTANLKKMFKKMRDSSDITRETNSEAIYELVTQVQYANDEGDFGMGLELGIDLFTFGGEEFHPTISHLLSVSYELLKRNQFTKIIKAHLADRRKGSQMSRF